jgi:hypothetical protein
MATKLPFLSDDHHFAIANVAAHAATLDQIIDRLVYLTVEPDLVSEFLVKNISVDRLVDVLRLALVAELKNYASLIDRMFGRLKAARTERNRVLHWLHETTESPDIVRFTDKRAGREQNPKDYTAKDIQKIADTMQDSYDELVEWWNLYNWHHEVRLHGKPAQLAHPPRWALPKKLRPPNKQQPRGHQPLAHPQSKLLRSISTRHWVQPHWVGTSTLGTFTVLHVTGSSRPTTHLVARGLASAELATRSKGPATCSETLHQRMGKSTPEIADKVLLYFRLRILGKFHANFKVVRFKSQSSNSRLRGR